MKLPDAERRAGAVRANRRYALVIKDYQPQRSIGYATAAVVTDRRIDEERDNYNQMGRYHVTF